jgi:hypothetical protein
MTSNKKGLIVVAIVTIVVATTAYILFKKPAAKTVDKAAMIDFLLGKKLTSEPKTGLMNFGDDYIKSWYEAAKTNATTFLHNAKNYFTQGGRAV